MRSAAMFGNSPIATNSVAPMPKPPRASARRAKRIRAGDQLVVGPSAARVTRPILSRFESIRGTRRHARRTRRARPGTARSSVLVADRLLESLNLAVELTRATGSDVRFEHERHPRPVFGDGLGRALDHVEHLVPVPLE